MSPQAESSASPSAAAGRGVLVAGAVGLALAAGALVTYKASAAMKALARAQASGTLQAKPEWLPSLDLPAWARPLAGAASYFGWVVIALAFGVLIGALVRAFVPACWLTRTVAAAGPRGQVLAALAGAPLMLCSCCIAPIFDAVYGRTRRLGPALGLMLASPALNPAALALTFLLFPVELAAGRLVLSLLLVFGASALLGRAFGAEPAATDCAVETGGPPSWGRAGRAFVAALGQVAARTLPAIALGVLASMALVVFLPVGKLTAGAGGGALAVLVAAAVAVPVALPTFGEIPIALALLAAGAPEGAALAVLVAGPVINLPSLLTLGRAVSGRAAAATGLAVFALAALGGLALALV